MNTDSSTDKGITINNPIEKIEEAAEDLIERHALLLKERLNGVLCGNIPNYMGFDEAAQQHIIQQLEKFAIIKNDHKEMLKNEKILPIERKMIINGAVYVVKKTGDVIHIISEKTGEIYHIVLDKSGNIIQKTFSKKILQKTGDVIEGTIQGAINYYFPGLSGSIPLWKARIKSIPKDISNILLIVPCVKKKEEIGDIENKDSTIISTSQNEGNEGKNIFSKK